MCKIIAFSGKIGVGKDYLINNIVFKYFRKLNKNVVILAFADYLKINVSIKHKISYDRLFKDKDEESRKCLQTEGTNQRINNENIYIDAMNITIDMFKDRGADVILITDMRLLNEFKYLKNKAILFRVNAPRRNMDKLLKESKGNKNIASIFAAHISEMALDNHQKEFNYILNNDYNNKDNIEPELLTILKNL